MLFCEVSETAVNGLQCPGCHVDHGVCMQGCSRRLADSAVTASCSRTTVSNCGNSLVDRLGPAARFESSLRQRNAATTPSPDSAVRNVSLVAGAAAPDVGSSTPTAEQGIGHS